MNYSIDDIFGGILFLALGAMIFYMPKTIKGGAIASLVISIITFLGGMVTFGASEIEKYGAKLASNDAQSSSSSTNIKSLEKVKDVLQTAGTKSMVNGILVSLFSIAVFVLSILVLKVPSHDKWLAGGDVLFGITLLILAFAAP